MATKLDPKIAKAETKLIEQVEGRTTAKAAGVAGSFLMSIFKATILPLLPVLLGELIKKLSAQQRKYVIVTRDLLNDADLGDA